MTDENNMELGKRLHEVMAMDLAELPDMTAYTMCKDGKVAPDMELDFLKTVEEVAEAACRRPVRLTVRPDVWGALQREVPVEVGPIVTFGGIPVREDPNLPWRWELVTEGCVFFSREPGQALRIDLPKPEDTLKFEVEYKPPLDETPRFFARPFYSAKPSFKWFWTPGYIETPMPTRTRTRAQTRRMVRFAGKMLREMKYGKRPARGMRRHIRRMKAAGKWP